MPKLALMTRTKTIQNLGSSTLLIVCALTLSHGRTEAAGVPLFAVARSFEVAEGSPFSLATGDLNRDGTRDLATANYRGTGGGTVSVLLGNGDGTFRTKVDYGTGPYPHSIVVGDVNQDAKPDLITASSAGTVSVLLGNGDGSFRANADYATGAGALSLAIGDVNGDGTLDLVTANGSSVSVLMGAGDGTFNTRVDYSAGAPICVVIADVNRDAKPDLATAGYSNGYVTVSVLLGSGDGSFGAPTQSPALSMKVPANQAEGSHRLARAALFHGSGRSVDSYFGNLLSLAAGDLNGDGTPDLVVAPDATQNDSAVSVLLGNGDGTFRAHVDYKTLDYLSAVAIGDVSGDGDPDIVTANDYSGTVSVLRGNGDGTFQTEAGYGTDGSPLSIVVADVSGDGRPDLVTSSVGPGGRNAPTVSVLPGSPDGTFQARRDYAVGRIPRRAAVGDVDGDGKLDAVTANWDQPSATVYFGNGDGALEGRIDIDVGWTPLDAAIGDLNGDGKADLAVANEDGSTVSVVLNRGGRAFSPRVPYLLDGSLHSVEIGDVNGDQKPDLVATNAATNGESVVSVLLGNGDGTFQTRVNYGTGPPFALSAAIGDVNRDGNQDLVTANYGGTVSVLLGNGDGTFRPRVDYATGVGATSVTIRDLNGDGRPDLVTGNSGSGGASVLLGNGDGTFQTNVDYGTGRAFARVAIGDLNGDGTPDLVATSGSGISVLSGNGDGSFGAPVDYPGGWYPTSVAIGDMNRDGKPDVVVPNSEAYTLSIFRNIGERQSILTARVELSPSVINLSGGATWLTAYVEPVGFQPADIDVPSLRLAGSVSPAPKSARVVDHDANGIPDLMVRFSRAALDPLLKVGVNRLEVTGSLLTGERFSGGGAVRAMSPRPSPHHASVTPNPANPEGTLSFYVAQAGPVSVRLFDKGGRLVRTILDTPALGVGSHHLALDGRGDRGATLASGVYFYRIETLEGLATGRFAILK
ncbi:MAG TPA: T9SS type A sorting domain-containing protein [Candidatus Eisenbacteria bacterium]|nr:T9SS type A sorting domain-containing protein [Candidatus Eisenbacteria bacterium]